MLQVYTGNGKGKTTAAIGLAIRGIGAGFNVYIMQFMKSLAYSEQKVLNSLPNIELHTTGKPCFIAPEGLLSEEQLAAWGDKVVVFPKGKPPSDYVAIIEKGVNEAVKAIVSGKYHLLILDEINMALFFGLISENAVLKMLDKVPQNVELVMTGRCAPEWLIERADLVTEMYEIKHYYNKGVEARIGIEN